MSELSKASKEYVEHAPRYNDEITRQIRSAYEAGAYWRVRHAPDRDRQIAYVEQMLRAHIFPPMGEGHDYRNLAAMLVDHFGIEEVSGE